MNGLITVIVPVYNVKNYINACVDSILEQTYHNLEVILVDDGSTDGSNEICDSYAAKDKRIKVIHKNNGGQSSARNTGLVHATGEFISFVDSDDVIDNKFYEIMLELITRWKADMAVCSIQRFCTDNEISEVVIGNEIENSYTLQELDASREMFGANSLTYTVAWNKLYRKNIIEGMTFPESKIYEDAFFMGELFSNHITLAYINLPLYFYRYVKESIMHKKVTKKNYDICTLHEEHATRFLGNNNQELYILSRLHYRKCVEQLYIQSKERKSEQDVIDYFNGRLLDIYNELEENGLLRNYQKIEHRLLAAIPSLYYYEKRMIQFTQRVLRKIRKMILKK